MAGLVATAEVRFEHSRNGGHAQEDGLHYCINENTGVTMEKRFQVFISSTFTDLKDERQAVLKSILELDHMPAGMELFPATDDSAWELIEDIIESSDYYVLIMGGRYGSLDEKGIGFTEKEYDYALSLKKPVIALLHENPDNLPRDRTESDAGAWERLKKFRDKVLKKHTCVMWKNADELKSKVIVGLTSAVKRYPAIGWVRADRAASETTLLEILTLKNRILELESESAALRERAPGGVDDLAQGDDKYGFHVGFGARDESSGEPDTEHGATISLTWDRIFSAVAPILIHEASERTLKHAFQTFLITETKRISENDDRFRFAVLGRFVIDQQEVETCIIQLRALGLIKPNDKKRSVHDTGSYWTLTPYGNTTMVQLRAIRKNVSQSETSDEFTVSVTPE